MRLINKIARYILRKDMQIYEAEMESYIKERDYWIGKYKELLNKQ